MYDILDKALDGQRLSAEEILLLFEEGDLLALGQAADTVRRHRIDPAVVTYIIDRNINYTNICACRCRFCAFWRGPQDDDAYVLSQDEIVAKVAETVAAGGTGILLQGGVHPGFHLEDAAELLRGLKEVFPHIHIHGFSAPEIAFFAEEGRLDLSHTIARLVEAGLDSIPGGGAEILDDRARRLVSPAKCSTATWLDVHRQAHRQRVRTTATMMFGFGEPIDARVAHLLALRQLQDETSGFTAFIPWTFQERLTAMEHEIDPVGGCDYLRTLAISRIALDNVDHIQGSWVTQGPRMGQLALYFGADDLGSIMIEENVVAAAGVRHRMTQRRMEDLIAGAGFKPKQRRTLYEPV